jgi:hypothetical protein
LYSSFVTWAPQVTGCRYNSSVARGHEAAVAAGPVVFARLDEDAVTGANDLAQPAAAPAPADARGTADGLAHGMECARRSERRG